LSLRPVSALVVLLLAAGLGVALPRPSVGVRDAAATEDISARTPYSTDFVNADGTRVRRIYQSLAFIPDPAGGLRPVDHSLRRQRATGWLAPAASLSTVSFSPAADPADMARLDLGDGVSVGFGVDGSQAVAATVDGGVARYGNLRADSDLELSPTESGFKEAIILRSAKAPTSWLFPLRTQGVTPQWDEPSGSVRFIDRVHDGLVVRSPHAIEQREIHPAAAGLQLGAAGRPGRRLAGGSEAGVPRHGRSHVRHLVAGG
jgi:hypothetical protein